MRATPTSVFDLKKSGLEAFLYAHVGAEPNGSPLTILSVLARLGKDPWVQAAGWAALPRATAIDGLSQSIAQMPLAPAALASSRETASHLVELLPGRPQPAVAAKAGSAKPAAAPPNWSQITLIWFGVTIWIVLSELLTPGPQTGAVVPARQSLAISRSGPSAPVPLPHHAAVTPSTAPAIAHQQKAAGQ